MQTMIFCEIEAAISDLESRPGHDNRDNNYKRMPFGIDMDEIADLTQKLYDDDELPFLFQLTVIAKYVPNCNLNSPRLP